MAASAGPVLRRLYGEFGGRVRFVTVYVREAHPGERVPQPQRMEDKLRNARAYEDRDDIEWTVIVDDLEGTLHRALDQRPNSAYLVDADGLVLFRSGWSNDEGTLREGLEAVVAGRTPRSPSREPRLGPALAGASEMTRILSLAGDEAKEDMRRAAPPAIALARTADLFQPLPSRARGVAAGVLVGLSATLVAAAVAWGVRRVLAR